MNHNNNQLGKLYRTVRFIVLSLALGIIWLLCGVCIMALCV